MMMKIILLALLVLATDAKKKRGKCGKKAMCQAMEEFNKRFEQLEKEVYDLKVGPKDYSLHFPEIGTTDYVTMKGMPTLEAITACIWMRSSHQLSGSKLTPLFSYATSGSDNECLFYMSEEYIRAFFHSNSEATVADYEVNEKVNDGMWHHLCFTWESSGGSWNISKDGERLGGGVGVRTGQEIAGDGVLILGQEQDTMEDKFDPNQSFTGDLSGANVWSRVLNAQEISELSESCLAGEGNIFKWSEFRSERHGNVAVNVPSECQAQ